MTADVETEEERKRRRGGGIWFQKIGPCSRLGLGPGVGPFLESLGRRAAQEAGLGPLPSRPPRSLRPGQSPGRWQPASEGAPLLLGPFGVGWLSVTPSVQLLDGLQPGPALHVRLSSYLYPCQGPSLFDSSHCNRCEVVLIMVLICFPCGLVMLNTHRLRIFFA